MTQRGWASGRKRSGWFAVLAAAVCSLLALVIVACELPSNANEFATALPVATACPAGQTFCNDDGNSVCADLQADINNCGTCGNACGATFECSFGTCACPGTATNCSGTCADLTQDGENCGKCGNVCATDRVCIESAGPACLIFCKPGDTNCGSACADLKTDSLHCNDCLTRCDAGDSCQNGSCVAGCAARPDPVQRHLRGHDERQLELRRLRHRVSRRFELLRFGVCLHGSQ